MRVCPSVLPVIGSRPGKSTKRRTEPHSRDPRQPFTIVVYRRATATTLSTSTTTVACVVVKLLRRYIKRVTASEQQWRVLLDLLTFVAGRTNQSRPRCGATRFRSTSYWPPRRGDLGNRRELQGVEGSPGTAKTSFVRIIAEFLFGWPRFSV